VTERKIITEYVHPPIPYRCNDWRATREGDDEDYVVGWGLTEQDAIDDLLDMEAAAQDEAEARAAKAVKL
jgi:hypothetical protein